MLSSFKNDYLILILILLRTASMAVHNFLSRVVLSSFYLFIKATPTQSRHSFTQVHQVSASLSYPITLDLNIPREA